MLKVPIDSLFPTVTVEWKTLHEQEQGLVNPGNVSTPGSAQYEEQEEPGMEMKLEQVINNLHASISLQLTSKRERFIIAIM